MQKNVILCSLLITATFQQGLSLDMTKENKLSASTPFTTMSSMPIPQAEKRPTSRTIHGATLADDYAWLRDPEWHDPQDGVKDPEIMAYLKAENAYHDAFMTPLQAERERLFQQRKGYIPDVDESVPSKYGDYYYYNRQTKDQNYPVRLRKKGLDGTEEVYFDANKEATDYNFYKATGLNVTLDGQFLIYLEDTTGNEFYALKIRNLFTGEQLTDTIDSVASTAWLDDNSGFYYSQYTPEWRVKKILFHRLGTDAASDQLIREESEDIRSLGLHKSFDKRYLFIQSSSKEDDSVAYIDLKDPERKLIQLLDAVEKRHLDIDHHKGYFYILTNDKGENKRLVRVLVSQEQPTFEEIIPHDPAAYITGFVPYESHFVLSFRKNGLERIAVMEPTSQELKFIEFPDAAYDADIAATFYEDTTFRYSYSSLARPASVFEVNFKDLSQKLLKTQEIGSGFDPELYHVDRLWAEARDGVKVPISLVYRKDKFTPGKDNPLLLYGYGSYGIAITPYFNSRALHWMDNGFVYAIAHIRGGDDLGYNWYLDGKYLKKKNTFHDYIDCAETLIKLGYTAPGSIAAMGGSAGGMLMGYVANHRPDLFKVILAIVPFVDVVNTMLDDSLPLTPGEFKEWGNPIESKEYFDYMLSYSPYDNMQCQAYPAMYIAGGLTDPRVTYWEPAKFMAKLRELNTGQLPALMRMNMSAGHGGGSRRDEGLKEESDYLAFARQVFGLVE
ncbi:S9 family peptidase [Candidatus Odyssella thessalonicensis]|uniref:S9 family peptidase n=1 Tax=Candidatus Odyssella thessalonicensis TaxID=84647 RepID=UPI000225A8CE|nr:S9 family peptidase [Candidatus Odyssella thessalonicensis]